MDAGNFPKIGELWLEDAEIPQILRGLLMATYDCGAEIWRIGICRIRIRKEDMHPPCSASS